MDSENGVHVIPTEGFIELRSGVWAVGWDFRRWYVGFEYIEGVASIAIGPFFIGIDFND